MNKKFHYEDLFTGGVYSYEVGVRKPDPGIYEAALKKAGVSPREAVFIDDQQWALVGAMVLGMTTILFTNSSNLREDLITLGLFPKTQP